MSHEELLQGLKGTHALVASLDECLKSGVLIEKPGLDEYLKRADYIWIEYGRFVDQSWSSVFEIISSTTFSYPIADFLKDGRRLLKAQQALG